MKCGTVTVVEDGGDGLSDREMKLAVGGAVAIGLYVFRDKLS